MSSTTQSAPSWHQGKVAGWIVTHDHKRIGALYLGWACAFFLISAILTVLINPTKNIMTPGFGYVKDRKISLKDWKSHLKT